MLWQWQPVAVPHPIVPWDIFASDLQYQATLEGTQLVA